jgi:mannose-6-phosphate isomerase-like protein (cupin superfamily)
MASPLIVRKGEGKKTIMIGPDPWLFRITGADVDGRFDFMEGTITYLQGPPLHLHYEQDDTFFVIEGTLTPRLAMSCLSCTRATLSVRQKECHIRSQT